jgi:beta-lactam-binding protein with PASTA domain
LEIDMAFLVGYVTKEERRVLEERGWDVEDAKEYDLVGEEDKFLVGLPPQGSDVVCIFVDSSVFDIMNGPDWEK